MPICNSNSKISCRRVISSNRTLLPVKISHLLDAENQCGFPALLLASLFIGHSTVPTVNAVQGGAILIQYTIYYCWGSVAVGKIAGPVTSKRIQVYCRRMIELHPLLTEGLGAGGDLPIHFVMLTSCIQINGPPVSMSHRRR